jgi:hypothetical protein
LASSWLDRRRGSRTRRHGVLCTMKLLLTTQSTPYSHLNPYGEAGGAQTLAPVPTE